MMTSTQVVQMSVTTTDNSHSKDYTHPDDHTTLSYVTPGFKPFTAILSTLDYTLENTYLQLLPLKSFLLNCFSYSCKLYKDLSLGKSNLKIIQINSNIVKTLPTDEKKLRGFFRLASPQEYFTYNVTV